MERQYHADLQINWKVLINLTHFVYNDLKGTTEFGTCNSKTYI